MKIVIIGLGTIGKTILKNLSGEGHTITIIDEDKAKVEILIEKYDVFGVVGNGACIDIQKEANMDDKFTLCSDSVCWCNTRRGFCCNTADSKHKYQHHI